jgi:hypothetical protein
VITDHATLVHLLKQSSDKLTDRQSHWVEKLMPYANEMRILYRKGILNEADPVSRRPDFHQIDLYRPEGSLWWDGNVPDIIYNGSDPALLALTTYQELNVDDDFLSQLKGAYSSCNYFSDENIGRRKRQSIEKSSDGLFRYYHRVVIPRPSLALIKALLVEYHDNDGHPNYRRLMATLLKRFWWDMMMFDCKSHCQRCIVCNRAKPDRRGGAALQPLGIPEFPWEIVGIDYVTDLPKAALMVTHLSLLWFAILQKWLTSYHATKRSQQRSQQTCLLIIVIDYMVFLGSLYLIETQNLLVNSGKLLWKS